LNSNSSESTGLLATVGDAGVSNSKSLDPLRSFKGFFFNKPIKATMY
jgi:hypothetical protein